MKVDIKTLKATKQKLPNGKVGDIKIKEYTYQGDFTVNKIDKRVQDIAKEMRKEGKNAKIQVKYKIPELGVWRSGILTDIRENKIHTFNPEDYEYDSLSNIEKEHNKIFNWFDSGKGKLKEFKIFIINKSWKGGSSNKNDCLYDCLKKLLPSKVSKKWDYPSKLKIALKLKRNDKINVYEHIDWIEDALNVQIFIEGDYTRVPKQEHKESIYLTLKNEHFTITKNTRTILKRVQHEERRIETLHYDVKNNTAYSYDGECLEEMLIDDKREQLMKSNNILINCENKDDLKEEYETFIEQATLLKERTKGRINMFKLGNIKDTALALFQYFNQSVHPEPITEAEMKFINGCFRGGMRIGEQYEGKAYKYDVVSRYPSLMVGKYSLPIKQGKFLKITEEELKQWKDNNGKQYFKFGIYKCEVSGNIDSKLFKLNENDYYSHIDLQTAYNLGYDIKLQCEECNFLYYSPNTCVSYEKVFKDFVNLLYPIKKEDKRITYSKSILNILWGALCEKQIHRTIKPDDNKEILEEDEEIVNIEQYYNTCLIEISKRNNYYKTNYARLSPFLTALARSKLTEFILKHNIDTDDIKWSHTDSLIITKKLKDIKDKDECELGEMGFEGKAYFKIKNCGKPIEL